MKDRREAIAGLLLRLRAMGLPHSLMAAFEAIPRQNFVPVMHLDESYNRGQLPIECGQIMISADQVARQLMAFDVQKSHRILEIGTGTGYQTALLGHMAAKVTSLERFRTLVDKARQRISHLGLENVVVMLADGREGMPGHTFDRIIINCACETVPDFVSAQLATGGIALVPVGPGDGKQMIRKISKRGNRIASEDLFEVRMQPFLAGISKAI